MDYALPTLIPELLEHVCRVCVSRQFARFQFGTPGSDSALGERDSRLEPMVRGRAPARVVLVWTAVFVGEASSAGTVLVDASFLIAILVAMTPS